MSSEHSAANVSHHDDVNGPHHDDAHVSHHEDDAISHHDDEEEDVYIPGFNWRDAHLWPGFIVTWPGFLWFCIREAAVDNPYRMPPYVYLLLVFALMFCIFLKLWFFWGRVYSVTREGTWRVLEAEAVQKEIKDAWLEAWGILPIVIQFAYLLFPGFR